VRIAALDLGSNSFHLLVAETKPDGSFVRLVREKEFLRLGDRIGRDGMIGDAADDAVAVVRRFKSLAEAEGATEIIALGTAALREAKDGSDLVDRIESEVGLHVKVVSGLLEAELIFEAVRRSVVLDPTPAICADLGGGSLELMIGDPVGLQFATSLHLGVGRLTAELVRHDPPTPKDVDRVRKRVHELLERAQPEIRRHRPRLLVGSSGTICNLVRMAAAVRDGVVPESVNQLTVSAADLDAVRGSILGAKQAERERLPGLESRRADLIPAGAIVLDELMSAIGLDEVTACEWALREGIVISAIKAHERADFGDDPRAIRRASVLALCRRFNWRSRHSYHVAMLALDLFDQLVELGLYKGNAIDRELLELGALLHDIGEHVSSDNRDRHSAYLIENGKLRGFDPSEIRMLTCLGRFHLRGTPRPSYAPFGALSSRQRVRCTALIAMLRVACALDRSHASIIESLAVELHGDELKLLALAGADPDLELWAVRRKQALFEEIFGVTLEVRMRPAAALNWELPLQDDSELV
jgi:exopolyphosphatase/guanosine-5'-triphosphate,3'-diphosphate pyrophosphatase